MHKINKGLSKNQKAWFFKKSETYAWYAEFLLEIDLKYLLLKTGPRLNLKIKHISGAMHFKCIRGQFHQELFIFNKILRSLFWPIENLGWQTGQILKNIEDEKQLGGNTMGTKTNTSVNITNTYWTNLCLVFKWSISILFLVRFLNCSLA
jgi:hypothetical protein